MIVDAGRLHHLRLYNQRLKKVRVHQGPLQHVSSLPSSCCCSAHNSSVRKAAAMDVSGAFDLYHADHVGLLCVSGHSWALPIAPVPGFCLLQMANVHKITLLVPHECSQESRHDVSTTAGRTLRARPEVICNVCSTLSWPLSAPSSIEG